MKELSKRVENMPFGGLYEIFAKANKIEQERGIKLVHMEMGRPDFDSPEIAKEAAYQALKDGHVHYTEVNGIPELRKAISEREARRHNLHYDAESEIIVTAGACEALTSLFFTLLNPGDEIIIPGPYFSAYYEQAVIGQYSLVELEMSMDNGWQINLDRLEELRTDKTKAILINSPNNPAGYILSKEEQQKILDFAEKYDLWIISDECYDDFYYEGENPSISLLDGARERTFVVKSASKSYSMTGWRIGYAMGPAEVMKYASKVHQNMSTCATSFAQYGAVVAYRDADDFIDNMVSTFKERGDFFYERLSQIKGLEVLKPRGAFYMFPKITSYGLSESEIIDLLLEEAGVVGVPGSSFGKSGKGHIRLAYCRSMEELERAATNMKKVLENL